VEIIHTIEWMKQIARGARATGRILGLVPTMGALHEGHFSLIREAQQQCSPVIVSIFVNPTQFGPHEDLAKYPRRAEEDHAALEILGVDYVFAPDAAEMYPPGFSASVNVEKLGDRLEGFSRPGHFRGVATVVLKLLQIVQPDFAYFGRKDAQQLVIIQAMARDLNLDARIVACPIVREADGLAISSRNMYLDSRQRHAAVALHRALVDAGDAIERGERDAARIARVARDVLQRELLLTVDYVEVVDADTLEPVIILRGACLILLAALAGSTRLIDNALITMVDGKFQILI
jgi:pantoate--beta-alanine ligase